MIRIFTLVDVFIVKRSKENTERGVVCQWDRAVLAGYIV
jgi:hypothetical protein